MKVIIAVDESAYNRHVVETIAAQKWNGNTQFKIVSVVESIKWDDVKNECWKEAMRQAFVHRKESAKRICRECKEIFEERHPDCKVHIEVREGDPREEIVNAAKEWHADKIIIGAHGRDICDRFLWGAVSRAVTRRSPCSVEIVRPRSYVRHKTSA